MTMNSGVWRTTWFGKRTQPPTNGVHVGALVKISENASLWNGEKLESWYQRRNWYVTRMEDNMAFLEKDETGKYTMRIPISTNFLTVLKDAEDKQSV